VRCRVLGSTNLVRTVGVQAICAVAKARDRKALNFVDAVLLPALRLIRVSNQRNRQMIVLTCSGSLASIFLYDHFYNQEQVSPSMFQFLRENPLCNLAGGVDAKQDGSNAQSSS
jgi:hypothetical protein